MVTSLVAMSLELDEDYFIQMHDRSANAETFREPYSVINSTRQLIYST